ncbi:MAG: ABC transporter ATP-binding protein [Saprospiraceae bacterium]|nr:ABC transporter ATP-binding protein [Saprospiraceae bacterium]
MNIKLEKVGKRFRREWIVRRLHTEFLAGQIYAIRGPNGSGKSTLLKMISGHMSPSKGQITFSNDQGPIPITEVYHQLTYAAPYIDLIEELSLEEAIAFHLKFKPFRAGLSANDILDLTGLQKSKDKQIRYFSSGMKQRLKLALAICSDSSLLLLDEPTTNFDQQGINWYRQLIQQYAKNRCIIIASNVELDFDFAHQSISILDYK